MTKARNLSKIIDSSGNLVVNNAGSDARSMGMVKADGSKISSLDRQTVQVSVANSSAPYAGYIPTGNCSGVTNAADQDSVFNTSNTYTNADGTQTAQPITLKKPRNGQWWNWASYGFTGIPTSNCANNGAYDGAGGYSSTLTAVSVDAIYSAYTITDEVGGSYQTRTAQNCNCGSFNCRTNCNCNCACACACNCSTDGG